MQSISKGGIRFIWQLVVTVVKTAFDLLILVVGKLPTTIIFLIKNIVYISWISLVFVIVIIILTLFMNFLTEISIWVWFHLDILAVDTLNIIFDFLNIFKDLVGFLLSTFNYPIEIIRVFLFEIYDNSRGLFSAESWIWFFEINLQIIKIWFDILKVFTENLKIAITEFLCQQDILVKTGDPYFCFIDTNSIVVMPTS